MCSIEAIPASTHRRHQKMTRLVAFLAIGAVLLLVDQTEALTWLTFSTNITKWTGEPFSAKCSIANYQHGRTGYSVRFFRTVDSEPVEIGRHVVAAGPSSEHVFESKYADDLEVHAGSHALFPVFDITVRYRTNESVPQNFWCELVVGSRSLDEREYRMAKSNIWSNVATATFDLIDRAYPILASCVIDSYPAVNKSSFYVEFYRDEELLGLYNIKVNASTAEFVPKLTLVDVGRHFAFPRYEIIIPHRAGDEYWYSCALRDFGTVAGTAAVNGTLIKSNRLHE